MLVNKLVDVSKNRSLQTGSHIGDSDISRLSAMPLTYNMETIPLNELQIHVYYRGKEDILNILRRNPIEIWLFLLFQHVLGKREKG